MTKRKKIITFVKSQPPFDVNRQYLDVSLIDLHASVSRFRGRTFTVLLIPRKSSSIIIGFYLFKAIGSWFSCI